MTWRGPAFITRVGTDRGLTRRPSVTIRSQGRDVFIDQSLLLKNYGDKPKDIGLHLRRQHDDLRQILKDAQLISVNLAAISVLLDHQRTAVD